MTKELNPGLAEADLEALFEVCWTGVTGYVIVEATLSATAVPISKSCNKMSMIGSVSMPKCSSGVLYTSYFIALNLDDS